MNRTAPPPPFISEPRLDGWISPRSVGKSRAEQTNASAALAAVHSINASSSFQPPRSVGVGSAAAAASRRAVKSGRLAAYTGGRHPYKRRKVIVSKVYCRLRRSASHWQPPRLDGGGAEAKRSPLLAAAAAAAVPIARKNLIQDPLYFFFFFPFLPSFLLLGIS